jgi:tetratricopeptide (TPR) repeat protein
MQPDRGIGTVCAALIVRDEARFLPGCLETLAGRVDEIVIVDTGSRDESVEVAIAAGAKVLHHEWASNFAEARNIGLEAANSDWILYIDADERLSLPDGGKVSDYLTLATMAAFVRFRPKVGFTRYRDPRIFRNDPRIRFQGQIHETVVGCLRAIEKEEGLPIVRSRIGIDHFGYEGDQAHKHARNLPLLRKSVKTHPQRIYYWHHLAETFAALGQTPEALETALEGLRVAESIDQPLQQADVSLIRQLVARLYLENGSDPLHIIDDGLRRVPDDYGLMFLKAKAQLRSSCPEQALEIAKSLRGVDPDSLYDGILAFDCRIFREYACELAGMASLALGDRKAAAHYFAEAASFVPDDVSLRLEPVQSQGHRH